MSAQVSIAICGGSFQGSSDMKHCLSLYFSEIADWLPLYLWPILLPSMRNRLATYSIFGTAMAMKYHLMYFGDTPLDSLASDSTGYPFGALLEA